MALKRRTDKFLFLYSKIAKAVLKIQTAARTYIAKKAYLQKHSTLLQSEVGWLVDVLKVGIKVTKVAYNGGVPRSRFMWLEGDAYNLGSARLCVAAKIAKGNMTKTKGIYIADIAEIRANSSSFTFKLSGSSFQENECLSIIGTERTVDLVVRSHLALLHSSSFTPLTLLPFPSPPRATTRVQFYKGEMYGKSRDWLVRTLNILVDKSLPSKELATRGRIAGQRASGVVGRMSAGSLRDAEHMATLLQKGLGVREYIEASGVTGASTLQTTMWVIPLKKGAKPDHRLVLASAMPTVNSKGINVSDISEVRFGKVSNAHDVDFPDRSKLVTIVGSETCLSLQFDDDVLKAKFTSRLQCYLLKMRST